MEQQLITQATLDEGLEAMHHLNSWLRSPSAKDHFSETREEIYSLKRRIIQAAEKTGRAYHAVVKIQIQCNRCGGSGKWYGRYGDFEHPDKCRHCHGNGTAELRFIQTTIDAGRYVWHTPWDRWGRSWVAVPEVTTTWLPNQTGEDLDVSQVDQYRLTVAAYLKAYDQEVEARARAGREEMKRLSLRAFCKLWFCEADFELDGRYGLYVYEPLDVDLPEDARPSVSTGSVIFYDATGNRCLARDVHYCEFGCVDALIFLNNAWYKIGGGKVIFYKGQWVMRHQAWRNENLAYAATWGMQAWRDPEIAIRWRTKIRRFFETKAHHFKSRWNNRWYHLRRHIERLAHTEKYRIQTDRWRQELYVMPALRLGWPHPNDANDTSYVCRVIWLQWEISVVLFPNKKATKKSVF